MKLYFIVFVFIWICIESCRHPSQKTLENDHDDKGTLILIDSSISENAKLSPLDFLIKTYSDSINDISKSNFFPAFLSNSQFDYNNAGIWSPSHNPLSFRYMIFAKVKNCKSLKMIIEKNTPQYNLKPLKEHDIDVPYREQSFLDLATNRYKELKCFELK